jgi:uncharacterized protein (DUF1800 family)
MLEPLPANQWNGTTAAHLLNRAGFGGSPQDIDNLQKMGLDRAVAWFVDSDQRPDPTPPPDWAHPDPDLIARRQAIQRTADPETKSQLQKRDGTELNNQMADLRYWWLRRMALGPRPFLEKMTLFWHGHFATSFEKVRMPYFLWLQNETIRQNALGSFNQLLVAVSEDPAMLRYLDGATSNKAHPNENFAREVMELFALGEGHYTEQDIQQAAKAYTGWGLDKDQVRFEYHRANHDDGPKTIFGQTGNYTGEDVLGLICAQPQCAKFISEKVWRFFVQDQPPQPVVDALAATFQKQNLDIKSLMRTVFHSKEFYAPEVIRAQIKSPVQWLIAATHQLHAPLPTQAMSLVMLAMLGQELFNPPNVKGWDGGIAWMTTNNLLNRDNFAAALVEGDRVPLPNLTGQERGMMGSIAEDGLAQIAPTNVCGLFNATELATSDAFLTALQARFINDNLKPQRLAPLQVLLQNKSPIAEADVRKAIRLIMCTPEYQLT